MSLSVLTRQVLGDMQLITMLVYIVFNAALKQPSNMSLSVLTRQVRFAEPDILRQQASALDQCVILTAGMGNELGQAQAEGLHQEQLRAYARFGCAQPRTLWCLRYTALWLRSKVETGRHRTMPRAEAQLRSLLAELAGKKTQRSGKKPGGGQGGGRRLDGGRRRRAS